jgi:hypothetical protein
MFEAVMSIEGVAELGIQRGKSGLPLDLKATLIFQTR